MVAKCAGDGMGVVTEGALVIGSAEPGGVVLVRESCETLACGDKWGE